MTLLVSKKVAWWYLALLDAIEDGVGFLFLFLGHLEMSLVTGLLARYSQHISTLFFTERTALLGKLLLAWEVDKIVVGVFAVFCVFSCSLQNSSSAHEIMVLRYLTIVVWRSQNGLVSWRFKHVCIGWRTLAERDGSAIWHVFIWLFNTCLCLLRRLVPAPSNPFVIVIH